MAQNPLNLALRFFLELTALYAMGFWGWRTQHTGFVHYLLMIGLPLLAAFIWGTFRVPADASANGKAPVAIPGWVRLMLELVFFSFGTFCFFDADAEMTGWVFGIASLFHYTLSYNRILWLLKS